MGVSTDAILCYGFDLGEELPEFTEEYIDFSFEEWLLEEEEFPSWTEDLPDSYWTEKSEFLDNYPVTLITHCSENCPEYIIARPRSVVRASRGYPAVLGKLSNTADDRIILKCWCEKHGFPFHEPNWLLCSYWSS